MRAGPAQIVVPSTWQLTRSRIVDLDPDRSAVLAPVPGLSARAVVTVAPADHPSLIPRAFRALLVDAPPPPRDTTLGGRRAWMYAALPTRSKRIAMNVTVLPTSAGVLAIACAASPSIWAAVSGCAYEVDSASVPGGTTLLPSPSVVLAVRLPAAVARLDRARINGRSALQRADTRAAQSVLARRLADQHFAAADELRPAVGSEWRSVVNGLLSTGHGYMALSEAASDGSAARFGAARRDVQTAEARLEEVLRGDRR